MKTTGIRKLRSNSRWWQFTEPELSSPLQPSAVLCSLVQPTAGRAKKLPPPRLSNSRSARLSIRISDFDIRSSVFILRPWDAPRCQEVRLGPLGAALSLLCPPLPALSRLCRMNRCKVAADGQ